MRNDPILLNLLCCPHCRAELQLQYDPQDFVADHVMSGQLTCVECHAIYSIIEGVPRLLPQHQPDHVTTTVQGFGYEWNVSNSILQNTRMVGEDVFSGFITPVQKEYFKGKIILDGGCGMGRFTIQAHNFGASAVVGVDLSDSVRAAFQNTHDLPNVLIIQGDLFHLPLRQNFDYAFSIGVVHHTPQPRQAFESLLSVIKPGGGISVWVYGRENNGWIIYGLNPIRRHLTSRLPRPILLAISYLISVPLFLCLKGMYLPVGKSHQLNWLKNYLFYFEYLYFLSTLGFHEQVVVVFDHLVPELAEYISRTEFEHWFDDNQLHDVVITHRNNNSWCGFGQR